jgi:hypothetical protein
VSAGLLLSLAALALVDSTSFGTLVIPVWLLLSPARPAVPRMLVYLGAIATFYVAVGVVLLLVASAGAEVAQELVATPAFLWVQLAAGVGLFALSWRYDSAARRKRGEPDRAVRWRERMLASGTSVRALVLLALTAGLVEVLSMLPYLAAIGLLVTTEVTTAERLLLLVGYGAVMILPALVLVCLRSAAQRGIEPFLQRLDGFLSRYADSALGWVLGIVGFWLAAGAATQLGVIERVIPT